mmetsp:Transcript_11942/g.16422  ORF Transcript_11942/g.16422 Transcript_11942/m.16422 type:complete len:464 (-) Transcript_11942:1762-3153(-)
MLSKLKEFDLYRRIPKDLTETTTHGSILSLCAAVFMLVLFVAELLAFLSLQVSTNIVIDPNVDSLLKINFNITILDMPCEFATIDIRDVLGTRQDNVTKNIQKWQVDATGIKNAYGDINHEQADLMHDIHHDIADLHANGVHAIPVDESNFNAWIDHHPYTFVDFYAPWCIWCQRLDPVWEAFAEKMEIEQIQISVIKVDCTENPNLCSEQKVMAFPLLRLFKNGQAQSPDYRSDRTVEGLHLYVHQQLGMDEMLSRMLPHEKEEHFALLAQGKDDHPGCLLVGHLLVNRVPGQFHIEARSKHHDINPPAANLSHVVNHLSFGPALSKNTQRKLEVIPKSFFSLDSTQSFNMKGYINDKLHQAFHHYIKVVSTQIEVNSHYVGADAILAYQMVESSQLMMYSEDEVPEARFSYDISPMAVVITRKGKHWYEFVTSICALIGGTFTVLGLLSGFLNIVFKPKKN